MKAIGNAAYEVRLFGREGTMSSSITRDKIQKIPRGAPPIQNTRFL